MQKNKYLNDNLIVTLTFEFSLEIIEFSEMLYEMKKFVLKDQILKSATSIGANVREAQNGESRSDFIHKFKIAAIEADEFEYWLQLCEHSEKYPSAQYLIDMLIPIKKIINKIISTSKLKSLNHKIT